MHRKILVHRPVDPAIRALAKKHDKDPEEILAIFQILQRDREGLKKEDIECVARALRIPVERAYGVASFYTMLVTPQPKRTIRVCDSPVCWLRGGNELRAVIEAQLGSDWIVERTSCLGLCDRAPSALVGKTQVGPLGGDHILDLATGWRGEFSSYAQPRPGELRVLLANIDKIDPTSIDSALAFEGYKGLEKALAQKPAAVIDEIEGAGLVGCGGAGFPTGRKWRFVAKAQGPMKFIVCNADESEPLALKDRVLMETNPHQVLEGMAISAYAVGAREGFIYIRGEYPQQAELLETAIRQAESRNWLGESVQSTDFSFYVHLHCGAGAYICGEETALLESLEGKRGEPRLRPPYPTTYGYQGKPTVLNNVETLAKLPAIMRAGAEWYRSLSEARTSGTKLYAVLGHVKNPGLFEAPFGLTLRQIINDYGGGMRPGSDYHFTLAGGAAGRLVSAEQLDIPIDYDPGPQGIHIGVGAFLVCDQSVSPVAMLRQVYHFFEVESCGKCTPCRVGTHRARVILDQMLDGDGHPEMLEELCRLAEILQSGSFCGLGISAAWPLQSAFEHFEDRLAEAVSAK